MLIENILNEIYPNVCGMCKEISKQSICPKCRIKLKHIVQFTLIKHCDKYFQEHAYLFRYEGELRKQLLSYKFFEQAYLYRFFAEMILINKQAIALFKKYDFIIPVPLHLKRMKDRGYNQTELIVTQIAKNIETSKVKNDILYKVKHTLPQSSLNRKDRKTNIKDVYVVKKQETIYGKKILLFDDIYTTGSTVNECSRILKKSGASEIRNIYIIKRLKRWELNGRFSRKYT